MARKRKLRNNRNNIAILGGLFVAAFTGGIMINASADLIEDGSELDLDATHSYSIVTSYEGVDVRGVASSDTRLANLYSDRIIVTNQVPRGMTFKKFGETNIADKCKGKVVDLNYDETIRTVSYAVEGLQAGCEISVDVIVRTPKEVEDEATKAQDLRRDFYVQAKATENGIASARSNLAHTYIGNDVVPLYKVNYEFTGDIPYGVPELPEQTRYSKGALVEIAPNPYVPGYSFSGWSAGEVPEGSDGFTMPANDVTLTGTFVKNAEAPYYKVTYRATGYVPANYYAPATKTVAAGTLFRLDQLTKDYAPENYGFSGWMTADAEIVDDGFIMPEHDVEIVGSFNMLSPIEEAQAPANRGQKHTVTYKPNLPAGCKDYNTSPAQKSYYTGEAIHISANKPICDGYNFKGWQIDSDVKIKFINEDYFEMPSEDITLRAVWSKFSVQIK